MILYAGRPCNRDTTARLHGWRAAPATTTNSNSFRGAMTRLNSVLLPASDGLGGKRNSC